MPSITPDFQNIDYGTVPNDGTGDNLPEGAQKHNANFAAFREAMLTLEASIGSGIKAYATLAALNADLTPANGAYAQVTNDPTDANNGAYRKSGASGTGSWILAFDRVDRLSGDLSATTSGKGASLIGYLTGTVKSFLDSLSTAVGGALIKYTASFTGAVLTSLADFMEWEVNSAWFGADRTGASDASAALQKALDAAAGKHLRIRPGTYLLGTALRVGSLTTVDASGSIFKRIGSLDNFIRNDSAGTVGGYGANNTITLIGGVWDSRDGTGNCTVITFGHCDNVTIRGATVFNENNWHHIEINACSNVLIDNCYFQFGKNTAYDGNEAVQIDSADNSSQFPWFGPYDGFYCTNVQVRNCTFVNVGHGVGTHSVSNVLNHQRIVVDSNIFTLVYGTAVKALNWSAVLVRGNRFDQVSKPITIDQLTRNSVDITITGNSIFNWGDGFGYYTDCRAINLVGSASVHVQDFHISDNTILGNGATALTHGITVNYAVHGTISNNYVENVKRAGVYLFGACDGVTISGNSIYLTNTSAGAYAGLLVGNVSGFNASRIVVTGNYCDTMLFNYVQRTVVTGNNAYTGITATNVTDYHAANNLSGLTWA